MSKPLHCPACSNTLIDCQELVVDHYPYASYSWVVGQGTYALTRTTL
jgi:hypothetical protein